MSDDNSSFLREVRKEVQRERLMRMADRYGIPAAVAVAVLILGVLVYYLYVNSVREGVERAGNAFIVAERLLQADKTEEAKKDFARLAEESSGPYVPLAKLRLASIALKEGDREGAKAYFQEVASNPDVDDALRSHAALQSVAVEIDELDWNTAKNRLSDLMDDTSPYRFSAREMLALVAFRENRFADARQILTALIAEQDAPQGIKQRAQVLMGLITAREKTEAPAATGNGETDTNKKLPPSEGQTGDASGNSDQSNSGSSAAGAAAASEVAKTDKPTN